MNVKTQKRADNQIIYSQCSLLSNKVHFKKAEMFVLCIDRSEFKKL